MINGHEVFYTFYLLDLPYIRKLYFAVIFMLFALEND